MARQGHLLEIDNPMTSDSPDKWIRGIASSLGCSRYISITTLQRKPKTQSAICMFDVQILSRLPLASSNPQYNVIGQFKSSVDLIWPVQILSRLSLANLKLFCWSFIGMLIFSVERHRSRTAIATVVMVSKSWTARTGWISVLESQIFRLGLGITLLVEKLIWKLSFSLPFVNYLTDFE